MGKLGAAAFTKKALSPDATYANFNIQASFAVQYALNERYDLRVEPFQFSIYRMDIWRRAIRGWTRSGGRSDSVIA